MIIRITVLDALECAVTKRQAQFLVPCLSYKAEFWRKGQFSKKRTSYKKQLFSSKSKEYWYFYTGHLERVQTYCKNKGWQIVLTYKEGIESLKIPFTEPNIPRITLREDQNKALKTALTIQRGVIKEPTGTGKTILQMGIMSAIEGNILLLAHTSAIVNQTFEKLRNVGWDCAQIGGGMGYYDFDTMIADCKKIIIVATIQSFAKLNVDNLATFFDAVIVDEAHRVSSFDGQYAKVLGNLIAPIRLGFTATLPTKTSAKLALEAFLGNLISEQTINEAMEKEILAVPKIKIIKSRYRNSIRDVKKYADVYQAGIVDNLSRNKQIVKIVKSHKEKGQTTLIFVNKIKHGNNLKEVFLKENIRVPFVNGKMENEKREIIKKSLIRKKRKIVIATIAWREGVDIPTLDVLFNAGGGKDELGVLQTIGRALRRTEEKDSAIIYDMFDPSSPFLVNHFGHRISIYMEQGWL